LQRTLSLTSRESELLLWISRGKANREIGEILAISPRAMNKHLEQDIRETGGRKSRLRRGRAIRALAR
jgi:DNA-binding CsgD family transcriptional regulator